jgi:hypothetical protein
VSRAAGIVFAALVVATFGAFFAAQRLKASPAVIGEFKRTPFFSPNRDGRFDRATVRFELRKRDRVTLAVVTAQGDEVRELIGGRTYLPYREIRARWDGRDDSGRRVADGAYRLRITLLEQGRNVVMPQSVRLDVTAPRPRVASIGPVRDRVPRPELLPIPGGGAAEVNLDAPGRRRRVLLFKTSPGPARLVLAQALADGARRWTWDGRTAGGRAVSPGTYAVVVEARWTGAGRRWPRTARRCRAAAASPCATWPSSRPRGRCAPAARSTSAWTRAASAGATACGGSARARSSRAAGGPAAACCGSPRRGASPASTSSRSARAHAT